ncbi:MAG: glycosyltransferase [Rhodobacteraceae bacterium]|nr:glycosyltransferase [Paracoccaceae bacterium]
MRFLQVASFNIAYLNQFYEARPKLADAPFAKHIDALLEDGFGAGHLIAPYMQAAGFESSLIVSNAWQAQTAWALARGTAAPRSLEDLRALVARQIEAIKPDVLYVIDPITFDGGFVRALGHKPLLVVGWRAAEIPEGTDWRGFDVMLSSDAGFRETARKIGARSVLPFSPGFPRTLAERVADQPKTADIVFCGNVTVDHTMRLKAIDAMLTGLGKQRQFTTALHLGLPKDNRIPAQILSRDLDSVWGLAMYRAVRSGRIAPNFHIDLAATKNQNMRILETTGVGTFLLTEADSKLADSFAPGREVETYANDQELIEKTLYYLDHEDEREQIARRGQQRCFTDHSMEVRAAQMTDIINQAMRGTNARAQEKSELPAKTTAPSDVDRALEHLLLGQINEAAGLLNSAVQANPIDGRALHLLGRVAFLVGEIDAAVEVLQSALAVALPPPHGWLCAADYATVLFKKGRHDEAIKALRQSFALNPPTAEIGVRLAAMLDQVGAREEAAMVRAKLPGANGTIPALDSMIDLRVLTGGSNRDADSSVAKAPSVPRPDRNLERAFPGIPFGKDVQCVGIDSIRIGRGSAIGDGSWLNVCIRDRQPRMVIGDYVLVGRRAVLSSGTYLEIGSHTIFGPNVYVSSAEHEYEGNHLKPILMCGIRDHGGLVVEENCWLGMNAVVSGQLTVGRGSVVGANSVLRQSIPPFSIAVGSPARVVRMWNPKTDAWEPVRDDADRARIEQARAEVPIPSRAELKQRLDAANGGQPLHPVVAGLGLHLP